MDFASVTRELLNGFGLSCLLFVLTLVFALPLGLLICFGSMSKFKPLKAVVRAFVWIIRGTPLMLQLFVVFYVPGMLFNACYFSEIYRGGIEGVARGQYEACAVLGMTKRQTFFKVILPQVIKRIVPPMGNEIITLVKDTSLAKVISVAEIIFNAEQLLSLKAIIWPLFYAGAFYLIFNGVLTILFRRIEKKLDYYHA